MRRLILALLTTAILLGIAPASAQASPVRVTLLREREMLTLVVQASDPASLLDFRFQYLDEYDREILVALRDYDQFRASSVGVTEACFVLRAYGTEIPVPQDCLNIARVNLHVQELGTASLFWFDGMINLQRPLTLLHEDSTVGVCPAENPRCEFEYPYAPPDEPPSPPLLFEAADLDNREILVLISEFERLNPEVNPLQPQSEWERVLEGAISEAGVNARAELLPQTFRSHDEARAAAEQYGATLVIWGYVGAAVVNSQYTVTPRWSQVLAQPGETEVIGTLEELALFVSPGGDVEYVFNFVMAQLAFFAENDAAALALFDRAIEVSPAGREVELGLGMLYFYRGYAQYVLGAPPEAVIEDYTRAIALNAGGGGVYFNRGFAYKSLGEYGQAIADFDQAIALNPNNPVTYVSRGISYYALGQYERAIVDYDQAITLDPAYAAAYVNRGSAYSNLSDNERAIVDYGQAIALAPEDIAAYIGRGNVYYSLGEFERAIADYSQAIMLTPGSVVAYIGRGNAYDDLGEVERAIADYDQAIALDPAHAPAYLNRGITYSRLNEYERAIADYDQAIVLNPAYAYAYNSRGVAYASLGEYERAIADYDRAIALNSTYAHAYAGRGASYANLEEYERAIVDYDQAIALDPAYAYAYNSRGVAYQNLGDFRAAYDDYLRAVEINPDYAGAYSGLVSVHAHEGRCYESADVLRRYLELAGEAANPGVEEYYRQQCGG